MISQGEFMTDGTGPTRAFLKAKVPSWVESSWYSLQFKSYKRERTQNSELYYTKIKILGSCLFLQSVPANLERDWLIDWTLFLNGEDISTKADSHICRCYSTTNNQNIHSEILLQKDIDKYSISKNKNKN